MGRSRPQSASCCFSEVCSELRAGVLGTGVLTETVTGTPQGGVVLRSATSVADAQPIKP